MALSDNLIHYYKLDGNSNDAHGANNGTDTGIAYDNSYGKINQGANFGDLNDEIDIGNPTNLQFSNTSAFSFSFWSNPTAAQPDGGIGALYAKTQNTTNYYGVMVFYDSGVSKYTFDLRNQTDVGGGSVSSSTHATGTMYFVVVTYDGANTMKIYVNGVLEGTGTYSAAGSNFTNTGDNAQFGTARSGAIYDYRGYLDEIGIWARELDSTDVFYLYNSGAGLSYASIIVAQYTLTAETMALSLTVAPATLLKQNFFNIAKPVTSILNASKPSSSFINTTKPVFGYLWGESSFPWTEESPWDDVYAGMTNIDKPI